MVDSKNKWKAWLYLSPALVLLAVFTVWPIFNTVRLAFLQYYDENGILKPYSLMAELGMIKDYGSASFHIGLESFKQVLGYKDFGLCLKNTVLLCVLTVPVSTLLALLIAVALNSIKALNRLLQTIFFLPYVTNSIAIGMVFAAMFNMVGTALGTDAQIITTAGIINNFLGLFGVEPINWLSPSPDMYWANMVVMFVYIVWNALPFKILVLLGGLQSVNKQYYDAAKVDGTSKTRVFWRITVPLLSPMISYLLITGFIGGFKEYSSVVGVFGEDMNNGQLQTMVGFIYSAIGKSEGTASAAAIILFAIILVVTLINLKVSNKNTHY
ncbi:MAG: sugar ABC transporter permease [Clostridia bacterium]|nr:sugar ABC transporter permease [Clostridia bacterium]MBQ4273320.1 sugar ABC transporter permease [Clostridia bacterium]